MNEDKNTINNIYQNLMIEYIDLLILSEKLLNELEKNCVKCMQLKRTPTKKVITQNSNLNNVLHKMMLMQNYINNCQSIMQ